MGSNKLSENHTMAPPSNSNLLSIVDERQAVLRGTNKSIGPSMDLVRRLHETHDNHRLSLDFVSIENDVAWNLGQWRTLSRN